jgi:hypothetical protein
MHTDATEKTLGFNWLDLVDGDRYRRWRTAKLETAARALTLDPVEVRRLSAPSDSEMAEIARRCDAVNFAHYATSGDSDHETVAADLRRFADAFGLRIAEAHRSAGDQGIVALEPTDADGKRGYIPYSTAALNWHTDGYYNAPGDRISAFVLHCVRPAPGTGGVNRLLDPEIAYIRLRDDNPDHLRALLHPGAMSIPENREADGRLRPVSVGPVFYPDPETGRMQMRYTARTRSIDWRDDPATRAAADWLRTHLDAGDTLGCTLRLDAGQGVLNNNVLHDRTGFDRGIAATRLLYRVRFHNRVARR